MTTKVMIVDDNEFYRTAFKRNLLIQNYDVVEAENADEAVKMYDAEKPDLVVTDLSMRTPTEGLDLIRSMKQLDPMIPVVMISAVGTFEEGSLAKELGADRVLSKQKIEDQIEELYAAIENAKSNSSKLKTLRAEIDEMSKNAENLPPVDMKRLRDIISIPNQHPIILAEAYDVLTTASEREIRHTIQAEMKNALDNTQQEVDRELRKVLPEYDKFEPETVKELRTAEYFFRTQKPGASKREANDLSRNMGFSYCFAVENEAKARLRRKLQRFLSDDQNFKLIRNVLDPKTGQLDLFFHQYLLRLQQNYQFDFTVDNVRQVFQRIMEHEARYKPDGLKALGIMIVCFGRDYTVRTAKTQVKIANPLGIKSFGSDEMTLRFAFLLVSLQHYRNPYIHPEISEMQKIPKIRETAIECLKEIAKLA